MSGQRSMSNVHVYMAYTSDPTRITILCRAFRFVTRLIRTSLGTPLAGGAAGALHISQRFGPGHSIHYLIFCLHTSFSFSSSSSFSFTTVLVSTHSSQSRAIYFNARFITSVYSPLLVYGHEDTVTAMTLSFIESPDGSFYEKRIFTSTCSSSGNKQTVSPDSSFASFATPDTSFTTGASDVSTTRPGAQSFASQEDEDPATIEGESFVDNGLLVMARLMEMPMTSAWETILTGQDVVSWVQDITEFTPQSVQDAFGSETRLPTMNEIQGLS